MQVSLFHLKKLAILDSLGQSLGFVLEIAFTIVLLVPVFELPESP